MHQVQTKAKTTTPLGSLSDEAIAARGLLGAVLKRPW